MERRPNVSLLASYARDTLVSQTGEVLSVQNGGPAYFLESALIEENIKIQKPIFSFFDVSILITPEGEFGKIPQPSSPFTIAWSSVTEPAIIISTILDEISLERVNEFKGKIFLDVQGFVRDGKNFGKKKFWNPGNATLYCVKATAEELTFLPEEFIENQKKSLLLITKGKEGSTLYVNNNQIDMSPETIVNPKNTIGAGDTLFGYFVGQLIKNTPPDEALRYATVKTSLFLSSKISHS